MSEFELITLKNGQRAVRHKGHGEVMHPVVGPWAEANALYVDQVRLRERAVAADEAPLCVFDVGLGAATNAAAVLSAWRACQPRRALELHSFEVDLDALRLGLEDREGFSYLEPWRAELEELISHGQVERDGLQWTLHLGDALSLLPAVKAAPELILHDPFSPESNPTLWTPEVFAVLFGKARKDAVLATYSASTRTRVSLLLGGFFVGVGDPIGFKKETTVAATRKELLARPLDARWLQRWERSSARSPYGREPNDADSERIRAHVQFASLS